ncbi:hypothetical protein EHLJMEHL_04912 [Vreelandella titanicae]
MRWLHNLSDCAETFIEAMESSVKLLLGLSVESK